VGSGAGGATLTFNPWLVLSLGASPGTVAPNGASALTADFLHRSDASTVSAADIAVLIGLPIAFGATQGSISGAQATIQAAGTATATFTHDATCLGGTATATVDTTPPPTVSTPIAVTCPDLTAEKTSDVGGSVPLSAANWTWTIHVANEGAGPAAFASGQTILTDALPGGASISFGAAGVANPVGVTGTIDCGITGGVLTCTANGAVTIASSGSFDTSFTATATAAGDYLNPSGTCAVDPGNGVPEGDEGNNDCQDTVTVVSPPTISKGFSPSSINVGGISTLTLTITNPNGGELLDGVAVTDSLPSGLQVAGTPNAANTCNGTLTGATAGSTSISLSNGTIGPGGSCAISVDVTATSGGPKDNTTGAVTSSNGGTGVASNTATLSVASTGVTALGPAIVWIGLRNSDDVGLRLDLRAEVFVKAGATETLIGSGEILNRPAGSSGFNNAIRYTIPLTLEAGPLDFPAGAHLEIKVLARRACPGGGAPQRGGPGGGGSRGHASGTARFWYNGQAIDSGPTRDAGSRLSATIGGQAAEYFLKAGLQLSPGAGSPRTSVDKFVNSAVSCPTVGGRPFTSFGTWITP
jgi:hypothetical protein